MRFASNTQEGIINNMCNLCNTGYNFGRTGCGCHSCGWNTCGCGNGVWNWGGQSCCRDCNGNIWVNPRCGHCCHGCNSCGNNGNGTTTQNGNGQTGGFTCLTFCGVGNNTTTTTANAGDLYYARQYGLYPFGYNCRCGCTLDGISET